MEKYRYGIIVTCPSERAQKKFFEIIKKALPGGTQIKVVVV